MKWGRLMERAAAARGDVGEVRAFLWRTWTDLDRHDEEKVRRAFAPQCMLRMGEMSYDGLEGLHRFFRWFNATYSFVTPVERRMDVSREGDEARVVAQIGMALTPRQEMATYYVEARCDYRLRRTEEGWRIEEQTVQALPMRTFGRHGALNYWRLMRHARELRPKEMAA